MMMILLLLACINAAAAQRAGAFVPTASFTPPELAARNFTVNAKSAGKTPMAYGLTTAKVINMDALLMLLILGVPSEWAYTTGTDDLKCAPETYWLTPYNETKAAGLYAFTTPFLVVTCFIVEKEVDIVGKYAQLGFNGAAIIVDKGACYCCTSYITRARGDWSKGIQYDSIPWYIVSLEMNGPGFVQWLAIDAIVNGYLCPPSGVFPSPFGGGNCTYDANKFGLFDHVPGDQHQTYNFNAYECNYVLIGNHAASLTFFALMTTMSIMTVLFSIYLLMQRSRLDMVSVVIFLEGGCTSALRIFASLNLPFFFRADPYYSYNTMLVWENLPRSLSASTSLLVTFIWLGIIFSVKLQSVPKPVMMVIKCLCFIAFCVPIAVVNYFAFYQAWIYEIVGITFDANSVASDYGRKVKLTVLGVNASVVCIFLVSSLYLVIIIINSVKMAKNKISPGMQRTLRYVFMQSIVLGFSLVASVCSLEDYEAWDNDDTRKAISGCAIYAMYAQVACDNTMCILQLLTFGSRASSSSETSSSSCSSSSSASSQVEYQPSSIIPADEGKKDNAQPRLPARSRAGIRRAA